MFMFRAHKIAAIAGTRVNAQGKTMFTIEVRLDGVRTYKQVPEETKAAAKNANWVWVASAGKGTAGYFRRSFSEATKRDEVLAQITGAPAKKAPAKKAPAKKAPAKKAPAGVTREEAVKALAEALLANPDFVKALGL